MRVRSTTRMPSRGSMRLDGVYPRSGMPRTVKPSRSAAAARRSSRQTKARLSVPEPQRLPRLSSITAATASLTRGLRREVALAHHHVPVPRVVRELPPVAAPPLEVEGHAGIDGVAVDVEGDGGLAALHDDLVEG